MGLNPAAWDSNPPRGWLRGGRANGDSFPPLPGEETPSRSPQSPRSCATAGATLGATAGSPRCALPLYLRRQLGRGLGGRGEDVGRGASPVRRHHLRSEARLGGLLQGQYVYGGLRNLSEGLIEGHGRIEEQRGRRTLHAVAHHVQVLGEKTQGAAHQQERHHGAPWETEARVLATPSSGGAGRAAGTAPLGPPASATMGGAASSRIRAGSAVLPLKTRCGGEGPEPGAAALPQKHPCRSQEGCERVRSCPLQHPPSSHPSPRISRPSLPALTQHVGADGLQLYSSIRPARCHPLRARITLLTREAGVCFGFGGCLTSRRGGCDSRVALHPPGAR